MEPDVDETETLDHDDEQDDELEPLWEYDEEQWDELDRDDEELDDD